MSANLGVLVIAAFLEIAGCFAFWLWIRRGVSWPVAVLGVVSLIGFALALTRVDSLFAGRASGAHASTVHRPSAHTGRDPTVLDQET